MDGRCDCGRDLGYSYLSDTYPRRCSTCTGKQILARLIKK